MRANLSLPMLMYGLLRSNRQAVYLLSFEICKVTWHCASVSSITTKIAVTKVKTNPRPRKCKSLTSYIPVHACVCACVFLFCFVFVCLFLSKLTSDSVIPVTYFSAPLKTPSRSSVASAFSPCRYYYYYRRSVVFWCAPAPCRTGCGPKGLCLPCWIRCWTGSPSGF